MLCNNSEVMAALWRILAIILNFVRVILIDPILSGARDVAGFLGFDTDDADQMEGRWWWGGRAWWWWPIATNRENITSSA